MAAESFACSQALFIENPIPGDFNLAWACTFQGEIHALAKQPKKALEYYKLSCEILLSGCDQWQLIDVYAFMGNSYSDLGELQLALISYQQCLEINKSLPGHTNEQLARHHLRIGMTSLELEMYKLAIQHFHDYLHLTPDPSDQELEKVAGALKSIGLALNKKNYRDEAHSLWLTAFKLLKKLPVQQNNILDTLNGLVLLEQARASLDLGYKDADFC